MNMHFFQFQSYIKRGFLKVGYGKDAFVDFLHVDNLVQAEVLAGEALSDKKSNIAVSRL